MVYDYVGFNFLAGIDKVPSGTFSFFHLSEVIVAVFLSSVEENEKLEFEIYPNPTNSLINIITSFDVIGSEFQICDLQGRKVFEGQIHDVN